MKKILLIATVLCVVKVSGQGVGINISTPLNRLAVYTGTSSTAIDTNAAILGYSASQTAAQKGGVQGSYNSATYFGTGVNGIGYNAVPFSNFTIPSLSPGSTDNGVYGSANDAGVIGNSANGIGVIGNSTGTGTHGIGIAGYSTTNTGVFGQTPSSTYGGVEGAANTFGIRGIAQSINSSTAFNRIGVYGTTISTGSSGTNYGVYGDGAVTVAGQPSIGTAGWAIATNPGGNYGMYAAATGGAINIAIYGAASTTTSNYAGYFYGNVAITGSISKGSGTFKIDHPLDPKNKYLYHSFVESPDMMNIYNGNITTDANGYATVEMPDYFDALNKDFRYQLTVIGTFAQAIIKEEMANNKFVIQTNQPNIKVSWQVTGVRHDKYADAHRVVPVVEKEEKNKGKYLHPAEWGAPETEGIDYKDSHLQPVPKPVSNSINSSNTLHPPIKKPIKYIGRSASPSL